MLTPDNSFSTAYTVEAAGPMNCAKVRREIENSANASVTSS
jgi:hypothetical protein